MFDVRGMRRSEQSQNFRAVDTYTKIAPEVKKRLVVWLCVSVLLCIRTLSHTLTPASRHRITNSSSRSTVIRHPRNCCFHQCTRPTIDKKKLLRSIMRMSGLGLLASAALVTLGSVAAWPIKTIDDSSLGADCEPCAMLL